MQINNEEFPACQLNETTNLSPEGRVLSKSLMINLRNSNPKTVWKAYLELKEMMDDKEDKPEKKVKKDTGKKEDENVCPECGGLLVEKQGISAKTGRPYHFKGCSNFRNGCSYTKNIPDKEPMPVANQDLDIERVPF